jgi:hypothetical protein
VTNWYNYAVSADGQRFLIPRQPSTATGEARQAPIVVVLNWVEGIKK